MTASPPPLPCRLDGCEKPRVQRSTVCNMHRTRKQRTGSYEAKKAPRGTPLERFHHHVVVTPGGHWRWCGPTIGKTPDYGRVFLGDDHTPRQMLAHRFSFELHNGPIPEGLVVDHLCRWTLCVNPLHLDAVTQAVNIERGTRH